MDMILTLLFLGSLSLLLGLFGLAIIEEKRERRFFASAREHFDIVILRTIVRIFQLGKYLKKKLTGIRWAHVVASAEYSRAIFISLYSKCVERIEHTLGPVLRIARGTGKKN